MRCFVHSEREGVGICAVCGKAVCLECVLRETPRLICTSCGSGQAIFGYEYRSKAEIAGWPLVHVCTGVDPSTMRPRIAKGIIAVGNVAFGVFTLGGVSLGLVSFGGLSIGLLAAVGGLAAGIGWSFGGLAIGTVAVGGAALGFQYAIGGGAVGPHVISATRCDPEAAALFQFLSGHLTLPPHCGR